MMIKFISAILSSILFIFSQIYPDNLLINLSIFYFSTMGIYLVLLFIYGWIRDVKSY